MRVSFWRYVVSLAIVAGCSSHLADDTEKTLGIQDAGTHDEDASSATDSGTRVPRFEAGAETGVAAPYAACPDVFAEPLPNRPDDSAALGLTALRQRVLQSRGVFEQWAAEHGDTYRYTRQYNSVFGGFVETTVEVTAGAVTAATRITGDETGSYTTQMLDPNAGGPAVTMEALYDECLNRVLCQDPRANWIYVVVDARGLLVQCGFFPMNCADDCYEGLEPLIVTVDGTDWTQTLTGCCPISPQPNCCMDYGGTEARGCGLACDGMPLPQDPRWHIHFDELRCARWLAPAFAGDCCGCPLPDGGAG